jgi:hypothetical protein
VENNANFVGRHQTDRQTDSCGCRHANAVKLAVRVAVGCWLLAVGCWLLAAGCWLLAAGCWLLAAGCWLLAVGCWLLAALCCAFLGVQIVTERSRRGRFLWLSLHRFSGNSVSQRRRDVDRRRRLPHKSKHGNCRKKLFYGLQ